MRKHMLSGLVAVATLLTLSGCGGDASAALDSYRSGPAADEITVSYVQGPDERPGHLEIVEESATRIRVKVLYSVPWSWDDEMSTMIGVSREAVARLEQPLNGRLVVDEHGTELRQQ